MIKASFCSAKSLNQTLNERINFEKKVHKPFESFYSANGKKNCFKGIDIDTTNIETALFVNAAYPDLIIHTSQVLLLPAVCSAHPKRGPPLS
jgi:hypothetical protein